MIPPSDPPDPPSQQSFNITKCSFPKHSAESHDSKAEAAASFRLASLGCIRSDVAFTQTFTDADGTSFQAKPDFFHPPTGLYIEFKAGPLNGKKTKANADRAVASRQTFKGALSIYDWLKHGWNHSKHKQAVVQRALTPQKFIVVFQALPTLTEALAYVKAGLVFIPLSALPTFLGYVRLSQAGVNTRFEIDCESTALSL